MAVNMKGLCSIGRFIIESSSAAKNIKQTYEVHTEGLDCPALQIITWFVTVSGRH